MYLNRTLLPKLFSVDGCAWKLAVKCRFERVIFPIQWQMHSSESRGGEALVEQRLNKLLTKMYELPTERRKGF